MPPLARVSWRRAPAGPRLRTAFKQIIPCICCLHLPSVNELICGRSSCIGKAMAPAGPFVPFLFGLQSLKKIDIIGVALDGGRVQI